MSDGRALLLLAGLAGLTGVVLAAVGSHAARIDNAADWRAWQAASLLHLLHAVALLGLAAWQRAAPGQLPGLAGILMAVGIVLFSGSIYLRLLAGVDTFSGIAPVGGACLMAGWALVIATAWRARTQRS